MTEMVEGIRVSEINFEKEPYIWESPIRDLLVISRPYYPDQRGSFQEDSRDLDIEAIIGRPLHFVQRSTSEMDPGTVKGIHCERQDKFLQPILGEYFFVEVDLRPDSPTFKKWVSFRISAKMKARRNFIFVPNGVGNSMAILGKKIALLKYETSSIYNPEEAKRVVRYDDPDLAIPWPVESPIISNRDLRGFSLQDFLAVYK